jgi:hypothetical protein
MNRRIINWYSEGVIYSLGHVDAKLLTAAVNLSGLKYSHWTDRDYELIKTIANGTNMIKTYIMDHCPVQEMVSELTNLTAVCKSLVQDPASKAVLYDQDTSYEFHQLVVATLLSYGKALNALCAARKGGLKDIQIQVTLAERVWYCAGTLWRISYSGMLRHHLEVLNKKRWFTEPVYDEESIIRFRNYTGFDHPFKRPAVHDLDDEDGDDKNDAINSVDKEFGGMEESPTASMAYKWFHVQVDSWESLSILLKHATMSSTCMQISLLAVKPPDLNPALCKLSKWQPAVRHLIAKHAPHANGKPIDAEVVIRYLNKQIELHPKVYSNFKADIPRWRASIHCETIIPTLLCLLENHPHCGCCVKELLKVYMWSHFC